MNLEVQHQLLIRLHSRLQYLISSLVEICSMDQDLQLMLLHVVKKVLSQFIDLYNLIQALQLDVNHIIILNLIRMISNFQKDMIKVEEILLVLRKTLIRCHLEMLRKYLQKNKSRKRQLVVFHVVLQSLMRINVLVVVYVLHVVNLMQFTYIVTDQNAQQ